MSTALTERTHGAVELLPAGFSPVMSIEAARDRFRAFVSFYQGLMVQGKDYGTIPGSDKPTLLKPGAEKLCTFFGLTVPDPDFIDSVKDWTGKDHGEPFFYFEVRQRLLRNGEVLASQVGSANSMESKHRYRWVNEHDVPDHLDRNKLKKRDGAVSEFTFAVDKAETSGKYGKTAEYWQRFKDTIASGRARQIRKKIKDGREFDAWEIGSTLYRIPNPDVADLVNTLQKMAQKRAFIAATLIAVNASEFFTQDLEDLSDMVDEVHPVEQKPSLTPAQKTMSAKLTNEFVKKFDAAATEEEVKATGQEVQTANGSILPEDKEFLREVMRKSFERVRSKQPTEEKPKRETKAEMAASLTDTSVRQPGEDEE